MGGISFAQFNSPDAAAVSPEEGSKELNIASSISSGLLAEV